jgi:hypothetical protein
VQAQLGAPFMTSLAFPTASSIMVKLPSGLIFLSQSASNNDKVKAIVKEVIEAKTASTPSAKEGPFSNENKAEIVTENMKRIDYLTAFAVTDIHSDNVIHVQTMAYYLDLRTQILRRVLEADIFRERLAVLAVLRQSIYYAIQARAMLDLFMMTVAKESQTKH